jgi:long-chain fatty acid transport protein
MAYATALDTHWYLGVGVWGVAGMGVDFSEAPPLSGLFSMETDLMIMHIATPVAYQWGQLSLGIAPILQVGMLDIRFLGTHPYDKTWDSNIGVKVGALYEFDNGLRIGAVYKNPISMTYSNSEPGGHDLELEQPQEYGIGFSYTFGTHTIAMDYKRIDWEKAEGYKAFGWKSENVFAVGYAYQMEQWTWRAGYNHAKSPIDTTEAQPLQNYLNLLGFPATSKSHYSLGASYVIGENYSVDVAAVYSPEESESGTLLGGEELGTISISNKHKEASLTIQINYAF